MRKRNVIFVSGISAKHSDANKRAIGASGRKYFLSPFFFFFPFLSFRSVLLLPASSRADKRNVIKPNDSIYYILGNEVSRPGPHRQHRLSQLPPDDYLLYTLKFCNIFDSGSSGALQESLDPFNIADY